MADIIQIRRDTASNWTSVDPVLAEGELGIEVDTSYFKIGDGTTAWSGLGYVATGPQGEKGDQGDTGADSTVPGPQGPQGPQGDKGDQGDQGDKGDQGDQGDAGEDGVDGLWTDVGSNTIEYFGDEARVTLFDSNGVYLGTKIGNGLETSGAIIAFGATLTDALGGTSASFSGAVSASSFSGDASPMAGFWSNNGSANSATKFVSLTQAQYDASSKDGNTIYFIE